MEGEIFDQMIENLVIQAQESELTNMYKNELSWNFKRRHDLFKKNNIKPTFIELLFSKTINRKREEILLNIYNKVENREIEKFKFYLSRRKLKEPIAYIIGYKYFWKYKFLTNKSVLIQDLTPS